MLAAEGAVVEMPYAFGRATFVDHLHCGSKNETCPCRRAETQAEDGGGIGEVAHALHVR